MSTVYWVSAILLLSPVLLSPMVSSTPITEYPTGWTYLPSVQKYYRVIFELVDWNTAASRCKELGSKSHLVVVNDATENQAIRNFLASLDPRLSRICIGPSVIHVYGGYWTSGQLVRPNECGSSSNPWVWKPYSGVTLPVTYSNFHYGEPNCYKNSEGCIHYGMEWYVNLQWNDINCAWPLCALCELDI